jgi:hypothetical protein
LSEYALGVPIKIVLLVTASEAASAATAQKRVPTGKIEGVELEAGPAKKP